MPRRRGGTDAGVPAPHRHWRRPAPAPPAPASTRRAGGGATAIGVGTVAAGGAAGAGGATAAGTGIATGAGAGTGRSHREGRRRGRPRQRHRHGRRRGLRLGRAVGQHRGGVLGQERAQRRALGVLAGMAQRDLEVLLRANRRDERMPRLELQRAADPGPQQNRNRLGFARFEPRHRRVDDLADLRGVLIDLETPPEHQRQSHRTHLRHVGEQVEARQAERVRHRDPQLAPVALLREAQLLERGPQHVLDHDQPALGGDQDPLGSDRAVAGVGFGLVEGGHGRHQLANQAQRGIQLERNALPLGGGQHFRQAHTAHTVGDDDHGGGACIQSLDGADAGERFVTEIAQARGLLAEGALEGRNRTQFVADLEDFQRFVGAANRRQALADAVFEHGRRHRARSRECWFHALRIGTDRGTSARDAPHVCQ